MLCAFSTGCSLVLGINGDFKEASGGAGASMSTSTTMSTGTTMSTTSTGSSMEVGKVTAKQLAYQLSISGQTIDFLATDFVAHPELLPVAYPYDQASATFLPKVTADSADKNGNFSFSSIPDGHDYVLVFTS